MVVYDAYVHVNAQCVHTKTCALLYVEENTVPESYLLSMQCISVFLGS